ncbi:MAG TPA: hypothetical protein DCO68_09690 [Methylophilaceae bacterium]|nr:hypothetical protein [Methylophilaceae bacterium]HAJ72335.1 hypothetical protein [Methylophilaceae bacterium]
MSYLNLAYLHLATVLMAFILGTYLLLQQKGSETHRRVGKCYLLLMLTTASIALLMPAQVGPRMLGHFGFIHLFCAVVFYCVPTAYLAARSGNIAKHKANMQGLYVGGILIAGAFTLMPGRLLHQWLFE